MDNSNLPDGLRQRFDQIDEKLESIHAHAVQTNGRVTKLERWSLVFITALVVFLSTNSDGVLHLLRVIPTWFR